MNTLTSNEKSPADLETLKKLTTVIYLCQALSFAFAGLPLLIGVVLNFMNRGAVEGTWLESHFHWQIKTAWLVLAGFALSGLTFTMGIGLYIFILIPTIVTLIYRAYLGWTALIVDSPISDKN
jgi:uncharacterized membrane protein